MLGIAVFSGVIHYKKLPNELRWFFYFLCFFSIIEIISNILIELRIQNILLYPLYVFGEFLILSLLLFNKIFSKKTKYILITIFSLFFLAENIFLFVQQKNLTNSYSKIIFHLLIISSIAYLLIKTIKEFEKLNYILVNYIVLFFYYSISLFLFVLMNQLENVSLEKASIIWGLNNLLSSILYFSFIISFFKHKKYV